jgi:hypothetical protein
MKRICLLAVLCAAVAAQDKRDDADLTNNVSNGRAWRLMALTSKIYYLSGFGDGLIRGDSTAIPVYYSKRTVNREIIEWLDSFYRAPENVSIAIPDAMRVFKLKTDGAAEDRIVRLIETLRRSSAQVSSKP